MSDIANSSTAIVRLVPDWAENDAEILLVNIEASEESDGEEREQGCFSVPRDGGEPTLSFKCVNLLSLAESPAGDEWVGVIRNALGAVDKKAGASIQTEDVRIIEEELVPNVDLENAGLAILGLDAMSLLGYNRPAFSPDGSQLAIALLGSVVLRPWKDGDSRILWTAPEDALLASVLWSADGKRLIIGEISDRPAIRQIDAQTGAEKVILGGEYGAMHPTWVVP